MSTTATANSTSTTSTPPNLALFQKLSRLPLGRQLFSKAVCLKAPYFASIRPRVDKLRPGYGEVSIRNRRAVHNHLGTVHAIAMCNMAELAGGLTTDVTVPTSHRWIPKGMEVAYLKKAETDLIATAQATPPNDWQDGMELPVNVEIKDTHNQVVARMTIAMWITQK